jgi:cobalt-precorrin 5A hydrolase
MRLAIISLTKHGTALNLKLCELLHGDGYTLEKYRTGELKSFSSIHQVVRQVFEEYQGMVFIGACGIAVRSIAPYVQSKLTDIPVVVCDEFGKYAIPILSGHLGGANELSERIAKTLGGVAVITTATDVNHKFSVDSWAKGQGLEIVEPQKIKEVSSAILDDLPVGYYTDIPISKPIGLSQNGRVGVVVSNRVDVSPFESTLHLVPKNLVLGIGCKRGTPMEDIEILVLETLETFHYSIKSVARVCSIDLKSNELGLLSFCESHNIEVTFYSSHQLNAIDGVFSESQFVKSITGVDCVCERSAVLGCGTSRHELIQRKISKCGVTLAIAKFC